MSIGLIGVAISLTIGVVLGSLSGFYGGWVDLTIQRLIEVISAMPTIPLWLGLAAAIPLTWSPLKVYFVITLIVSLLAWTGLAREVRGRFFALRGEDFVTAARLDGSTERRVIFRHILPSLTSHILAVVTLAIPTMIVAETALSFLGIGLKPPVVSWGVLLQDAQNIRTIATAPWLLIWPSLAVVLAVLAFNFMGDGLRDAADPYETLMGTKPNGRPTLVHPAPSTAEPVLSVRDLSIDFHLRTHILHAVRNVSFDLMPGRTLGLVGESGSGKSVTARALLRIIDKQARVAGGRIILEHRRPDDRRSTQLAPSSREIRAHPRPPHRPDLPGADALAVAGPHHRRPDHRGAAPAPQARQARRPRRDDRAAPPGRDRRTPSRWSTATPSSSPAACASAR